MTTAIHHEPRVSRVAQAFGAFLVLIFWAIAALPLIALRGQLRSLSPGFNAIAKIGVITLAAWLYMRLAAPRCTVDQALLVGVVWLLLDIGAEVAAGSTGRGLDLIGVPGRPGLRDVVLLTWIVAPALFARYTSIS